MEMAVTTGENAIGGKYGGRLGEGEFLKKSQCIKRPCDEEAGCKEEGQALGVKAP